MLTFEDVHIHTYWYFACADQIICDIHNSLPYVFAFQFLLSPPPPSYDLSGKKQPWNFDIPVALVLAHYYLARNMPCHGRGTSTEYWKRVLGVIDFLYRKIGGGHEQAPETQGYQWVGRDECEYDVHQMVG